MRKPLTLAALLGALALPSLPAGAADVVTITDYGADGDNTYYQVTCSDNTRASVVIVPAPRKVCAHPAAGAPQCRSSWTVREAAVKACQ